MVAQWNGDGRIVEQWNSDGGTEMVEQWNSDSGTVDSDGGTVTNYAYSGCCV